MSPSAKPLASWQPRPHSYVPYQILGLLDSVCTLGILWKTRVEGYWCDILAFFKFRKQILGGEQKLSFAMENRTWEHFGWTWPEIIQVHITISSDTNGCPAFGEHCFQLDVQPLSPGQPISSLWTQLRLSVRQPISPAAIWYQWGKWVLAPLTLASAMPRVSTTRVRKKQRWSPPTKQITNRLDGWFSIWPLVCYRIFTIFLCF